MSNVQCPMSNAQPARRRWSLVIGHWSLVIPGMLLLGTVRADSPPAPGKGLAAEGPLFQIVQPPSVAVLATGVVSVPDAGPWCAVTAVLAGSHPQMGVWDFNGPLTTRPGRILLGAQTLFLGSFSPAASLPAGLRPLGILQAGEDVGCWALIDTDLFRPLPAPLQEFIRDGTAIATGTLEAVAYPKVLTQAHYTSQRAFQKAARRDLTYAQIFAQPATYRFQPVHIEGRLRMLSRLDPPLESQADGVSDLYEAWVLNEDANELFCFLFTELPPSLRPFLGEKGKKKIKEDRLALAVSGDGYFYKKFRYKALDSKANTARDAPVFVGHTIVVHSPPGGTAEETDEWGNHIMAVFLGIVGLAVVVVVGMTWWFRRSDRQIRGRVLAARHTGFVPPTEEESGDRPGDFSGPAR